MGKYTAQIRRIYLDKGREFIFDFEYPLFDPYYRKILEDKIIAHYYFREHEGETVEQWKWFLKTRMNEIMPYYNQLYGSEHLITSEDYYINMNTVETHTRDAKQTSKGSSTSSSTGEEQSVFNDTPQAKLQNLDYATNVTDSTESGSGKSASTGEADSFETYVTKLTGGGGVRYNSDILMEWRKTFINIDMMIINDLKDCFINIY